MIISGSPFKPQTPEDPSECKIFYSGFNVSYFTCLLKNCLHTRVHWFWDSSIFCKNNGVTQGTQDKVKRRDPLLTRLQIVVPDQNGHLYT